MPVVKLVNNANRSLNPFKGQFLLNFRIKLRNDETKGKIVGDGNYVFNHYQQLIELEEYLIQYLNSRVSQKDLDKSVLKWSIDEDLQKSFLYYRIFFLKKEHDAALEEIWRELKIQIHKVDKHIEEELNKMWNSYFEYGGGSSAAIGLYNRAYGLIKDLNNQIYFRASLKLLSSWIQLICSAKGVSYEVTQKVSSNGIKFDVFADKEKPKEVLDEQAKNIQELKKRYLEYEKNLLKKRLSEDGSFSEVKIEGGDSLQLYYSEPPVAFNKDNFIKRRKQLYYDDLMNLSPDLYIPKNVWDNISTISKREDLEDYRQKNIFQKIVYDSSLVRNIKAKTGLQDLNIYPIFQNLMLNEIKPTLANVVEDHLKVVSPFIPTGFSFKPLMTKFKQSKVDSKAKFESIVTQFMNSLNVDYSSEPFKGVYEHLMSFELDEFLATSEAVDSYVEFKKTEDEPKEKYDTIFNAIKEINQLDNPSFMYRGESLNSVKEAHDKKNRDLIKSLHSEKLGVIESENGKSAYQVYLDKKSEIDLKVKALKEAFPVIEDDTLIFKNLKRTPVYEKDVNGEVIIVDGAPLRAYEKDRNGVARLDSLGNPIPKFENITLGEIKIDRMPIDKVDALPGKEREVELSDDTSVKAFSPFKFTHIVKVKPAVVNGIEKDIITKGPFKGFSVEDLANATGKFLGEGQSYSVDANGNLVSTHEIITEEGGDPKINFPVLNEPYITWSKGRFLIGLPPDNKHAGERSSLKDLQKTRASIEIVPGSAQKRWSYYFDGDDYEAIKDALGSCLMSKKAHEELKKYYARILEKDRALNPNNLENFTVTAIGGFKEKVKLNNKQIEALAWLSSNDFKGVMALDTGVGKTLTGVSAMLLASKSKPNGKFLIVGPERLVGNFKGEITKFLDESVAKDLLDRTTEIGYNQFVKMYKEGFNFKSEYYCMIFDEVNEALTGKKAEAISAVKHPRKILLTASSLEKSPVDLFRFVSLASGNPIDPDKERAFAEKFAVNIGGKFVGIKPTARHQFNVWLKQNAYFANKMDVNYADVDQTPLKPLVQTSSKVNMDTKVAKAYQKISNEIEGQLKEMQQRYAYLLSEGKPENMPEELQKEKDIAVGALKDKIALLHLFSLNPNKAMAKLEGGKASDYSLPNPKIQEASRLASELIEKGKRSIYFTEDNDVAKETVMALSDRIKGRYHALCLTSHIQFFYNGLPVKNGKVTKKTNLGKFQLKMSSQPVLPPAVQNDMTWAIKTVKKFINENVDVATVTCNSSYARGFNLQNFKAVIHLDRDGWDSEEIKQRTARAFRQGQDDEVLEVMIDAVMPPDLESNVASIDEIRAMVHGADQKFFNDIIKSSGAIKLSKNYDSIEHAYVSDKSTKADLENFSRSLIPTREVLNEIEVHEKNREEDPILHTTLDPNRFNHPSLKNLTEKQKKMADISGLSAIANVAADQIKLGTVIESKETHVNDISQWLQFFSREVSGLDVHNEHFAVQRCAPNSIGNRALFSQLISMKKYNMRYLHTDGAGDGGAINRDTGRANPGMYIGYYVWPKFGYNANVEISYKDILEYSLKYQEALADKFKGSSDLKPSEPTLDKMYFYPSVEDGFGDDLKNYDSYTLRSKLLDHIVSKSGVPFLEDIKVTLKDSFDKMGIVVNIQEEFSKYGTFRKMDYVHEVNAAAGQGIPISGLKQSLLFPWSVTNDLVSNNALVSKDKIPDEIRSGGYEKAREYLDEQAQKTGYKDYTKLWDNFILNYDIRSPLIRAYIEIARDGEYYSYNNSYLETITDQKDSFLTRDEKKELKEKYDNDMVLYHEAVRDYESRPKSKLEIDLNEESIRIDIENGVYRSSLVSFLKESGYKIDFWKMKLMKAAYLIEQSGVVKDGIETEILDLYSIVGDDGFKAGEIWWMYNGRGTSYTLDLDSNSKSYKHLTKYMKAKVKESGFKNLEEYLSSPIEPFDVDSYKCWKTFFEDSDRQTFRYSPEDKVEIVKGYRKNLMKVLLNSAGSYYEREELLYAIKDFEKSYGIKVNIGKLASLNKEENEDDFISSENLMYNITEKEDAIFSSIISETNTEKSLEKAKHEIAQLRGDLKHVSNPFKNKKGKK